MGICFAFDCRPSIELLRRRAQRSSSVSVAVMVNVLLPLLLELAVSDTNAASVPNPPPGPSVPMNLTTLHSYVTDTTSIGDGRGGIDPRFSIRYRVGDIPLRPLACLMNAVNAMTNLALEDFDGSMGPVVARLPSYPDVVIRNEAASPSPGTMPIRYILWGIWSFALFVLGHDIVQTMLLTLAFDGAVVGYLMVEKPDSEILMLAGSSEHGDAEFRGRRSEVALPARPLSKTLADLTMMSNTTSLSLTNTTTPSHADNLRVFIHAAGQPLTNIQFFLPILAGLGYVSRFPSTSPVEGFKLRPAPATSDTWIEFRDFGPQPRTEAPFFEYRWVAMALGELTGQMVLLGEWREAVVVMQVDGISVGDGWIRKDVL